MSSDPLPDLLLPKGWPGYVRSAVLNAISMAATAVTIVRGWWTNSSVARVRMAAELEIASNEISLLKEELRIKDARLARLDPRRRPHYPPTERMAILELRAARGWSLAQAAKAFHVTAATVSSWMRRLDEQGPSALVQTPEPVNCFPDLVRHLVQRLKVLNHLMGKKRIAKVQKTLARNMI